METKTVEFIFGCKEELIKLGKDKLYDSLLSIITDIDKKYIIKTSGMNEEIYTLLGFKNNEEIKETLNHKSILEIKPHLKTLSNNIIDALKDDRSFMSECFNNYYNKNMDVKISFEARVYKYENDKPSETINIDFHIWSLGKNHGGGSGISFNFDLIDSEKLNNVKQEVISSDLMECMKTEYLEYFNESSESRLTMEQAKQYYIDGIKEWLTNYMYGIEDDLKTYETLKELKLKERVEEYLSSNSFTGSFHQAIDVDYRQYKASNLDSLLKDNCKEGCIMIDENSLEIKFLGELIKTISKTSYTVYEIK